MLRDLARRCRVVRLREQPPTVAAGTSPEPLTHRLERFLEHVRTESGVPGIALALSVAGHRAFAHAGTLAADDPRPLTDNARFHLGCIMKSLLALVALELARSRELDLDAVLASHLTELRDTYHGETIRVRHLLSHTSGYQGTSMLTPGTRTLTWPRFVTYLREASRFFVPGTVFNYEHTEAVLLEKLLTRLTGESSLALIRRIVLDRLGIGVPVLDAQCEDAVRVGHHAYDPESARFVRARIEPPPPFWHAAFSSHTLSLGELIALAEGLAGASPGRNAAFDPGVLELLRKPVITLPRTVGGPLRELLPTGFGLGAACLRGGWHGHMGIAQGQCVGLRYDGERRMCVAVGLNAMTPYLRDLILSTVCASLTGIPSPREEPGTELDFGLSELAGVYRGGGDQCVVASFSAGRLVCEIGARGASKGLEIELVADEARGLRLNTPVPQLSIGFFREPARHSIVLMLGMNAYKRVDEHGGSSKPPSASF